MITSHSLFANPTDPIDLGALEVFDAFPAWAEEIVSHAHDARIQVILSAPLLDDTRQNIDFTVNRSPSDQDKFDISIRQDLNTPYQSQCISKALAAALIRKKFEDTFITGMPEPGRIVILSASRTGHSNGIIQRPVMVQAYGLELAGRPSLPIRADTLTT